MPPPLSPSPLLLASLLTSLVVLPNELTKLPSMRERETVSVIFHEYHDIMPYSSANVNHSCVLCLAYSLTHSHTLVMLLPVHK